MNFENFNTNYNKENENETEESMTILEAHTFLGSNKELKISPNDLDQALNTGNVTLSTINDLREQYFKADEDGDADKVNQFHKMLSEVNEAAVKIDNSRQENNEIDRKNAEEELASIINKYYDELIEV